MGRITNYLQSNGTWNMTHLVLITQNLMYKFKGAVIDKICFARSKFAMSLVHKKNFSLIWQVVFKLGYIFCKER